MPGTASWSAARRRREPTSILETFLAAPSSWSMRFSFASAVFCLSPSALRCCRWAWWMALKSFTTPLVAVLTRARSRASCSALAPGWTAVTWPLSRISSFCFLLERIFFRSSLAALSSALFSTLPSCRVSKTGSVMERHGGRCVLENLANLPRGWVPPIPWTSCRRSSRKRTPCFSSFPRSCPPPQRPLQPPKHKRNTWRNAARQSSSENQSSGSWWSPREP